MRSGKAGIYGSPDRREFRVFDSRKGEQCSTGTVRKMASSCMALTGGAHKATTPTEKVRTGTFGGHTVEQSRFSATIVCRMCLAQGATCVGKDGARDSRVGTDGR